MNLTKYRLSVPGLTGQAVIVYENGQFKSFLTDVKPPFNQMQLNWILSHIPALELMLPEGLILKAKGKIVIEKGEGDVKLATNEVIALYCEFYQAKTKLKYKVSKADAGKMTGLSQTGLEWQKLFQTYFDSQNFLFKNKYSIANLVKYWNELRAEAFGVKPIKEFPLPYSNAFFLELNTNDQRGYWAFLRENGYSYVKDARGKGEWVRS